MNIGLEVHTRLLRNKLRDFFNVTGPERFKFHKSKVIVRVASKIVKRTPVKTGRARGGWVVSMERDTEETGRLDKIGNATITQIISDVAQIPWNRNAHITNPVPYVKYLENGPNRSDQAPEGFILVTVHEEGGLL
jgi:hypothetical protein